MNLPHYEFLSAPLWLLTALHLLTLTLHFVAMNFLLGGVLIVLHAGIRKRWDDPTLLDFVRMFPSAMAATVTLGVAPLLFLQLVFHRQVYSAAIVSGWFWLGVVAAAIVAYYALYRASWKAEKSGQVSRPALATSVAPSIAPLPPAPTIPRPIPPCRDAIAPPSPRPWPSPRPASSRGG